jgi:hypothetical protein
MLPQCAIKKSAQCAAQRAGLAPIYGSRRGSLSHSRTDPKSMTSVLSRQRPVLPGEALPPMPPAWPTPAPVLPTFPRA